jgi:hypothetical protein
MLPILSIKDACVGLLSLNLASKMWMTIKWRVLHTNKKLGKPVSACVSSSKLVFVTAALDSLNWRWTHLYSNSFSCSSSHSHTHKLSLTHTKHSVADWKLVPELVNNTNEAYAREHGTQLNESEYTPVFVAYAWVDARGERGPGASAGDDVVFISRVYRPRLRLLGFRSMCPRRSGDTARSLSG